MPDTEEPKPLPDDVLRAGIPASMDAAKGRDCGRYVWAVRCRVCRSAWTLAAPTDAELAELREHSAGHQRVTT